MNNVVKGNFGKTVTAKMKLEALMLEDTNEESTLQHGKLMPILRRYNVGLTSQLYIIISHVAMRGEHIKEFLDLANDKSVSVIISSFDVKPGDKDYIDYTKPLISVPGYLEMGLNPMLYITSPNAMNSENAGIKVHLHFLPANLKGPTFMYSCDDKVLAVEILFNTIDETNTA